MRRQSKIALTRQVSNKTKGDEKSLDKYVTSKEGEDIWKKGFDRLLIVSKMEEMRNEMKEEINRMKEQMIEEKKLRKEERKRERERGVEKGKRQSRKENSNA